MKMKVRYIVIFLIMFSIVCTMFVANRKKPYTKCSSELKDEVVLMAEFGMVMDKEKQAVAVMSFMVDDIIYGVGHSLNYNANNARVYNVLPEFNQSTSDTMGNVRKININQIMNC